MSEEFKAINTQEEFDVAIKDRIAREQKTIEAKYADYGELKSKNVELLASLEANGQSTKAHEQVVADLNAKIADYETAKLKTQIALKNGIPFDLSDRLQGSDEQSITKDAERMAAFIKPSTPPPLGGTETGRAKVKDENEAIKALIKDLNLQGE